MIQNNHFAIKRQKRPKNFSVLRLSILHGVPHIVEDLLEVKNRPCTKPDGTAQTFQNDLNGINGIIGKIREVREA